MGPSREPFLPPRPRHVLQQGSDASDELAPKPPDAAAVATTTESTEGEDHDDERNTPPQEKTVTPSEFKPHFPGTPIFTTPVVSPEHETACSVQSSLPSSSDTLSDTSECSSIYSVRLEAQQPYPSLTSEQQNLVCSLRELPNRICLKVSKTDGGVVFLVPQQLNYFLMAVFNRYADAETETLSMLQFGTLVDDARLLPKRCRKTVRQRQEAPLVKAAARRKDRADHQRYDKLLRCVFCHRDNVEGNPIRYGQFLRVLHRLARVRYRQCHIRDDEAVNALVAHLARSGVWVKPSTAPPKDVRTQLKAVVIHKPKEAPTPPPSPKLSVVAQRVEVPKVEPKKKLPAPLKKKVIPQQQQQPKMKPTLQRRPLARSATWVAEKQPDMNARSSTSGSKDSASTSSSVLEQRETEWLEKKAYELFRYFADDRRGDIPRMSDAAFDELMRISGLSDHIELEDLLDLYDACVEDDAPLEGTLDFLSFKDIIRDIGDTLYVPEGFDEDEATYRTIRDYLLPLLYHIDHTTPHTSSTEEHGAELREGEERLFSQPPPLVEQPPPGWLYPYGAEGWYVSSPHPGLQQDKRTGPRRDGSFEKLRKDLPDADDGQTTSPREDPETSRPVKTSSVASVSPRRRSTQLSTVPETSSLATHDPSQDQRRHSPLEPQKHVLTLTNVGDQRELLPSPQWTTAGLYPAVPTARQPPTAFRGTFRTSPYIVSYEGQIVRESDGFPLYGFTAGPCRTVIGPDGRPLFDARIGEDGLRVEVLDEALLDELQDARRSVAERLPSTLYARFPVRYETSSDASDTEDSSVAYGASRRMTRRPVSREPPLWDPRPQMPSRPAHLRRRGEHDIGLAGAPRTQLFQTSGTPSSKPLTFLNPDLDKVEAAEEDEVEEETLLLRHRVCGSHQVMLEGYIWPPLKTIHHSGIKTPRFG